jgi:hypothetical protein
LNGRALRSLKNRRFRSRTIIDFERGARTPQNSTKLAIKAAFEKAGIEFIDENGGGRGLRRRDAE